MLLSRRSAHTGLLSVVKVSGATLSGGSICGASTVCIAVVWIGGHLGLLLFTVLVSIAIGSSSTTALSSLLVSLCLEEDVDAGRLSNLAFDRTEDLNLVDDEDAERMTLAGQYISTCASLLHTHTLSLTRFTEYSTSFMMVYLPSSPLSASGLRCVASMACWNVWPSDTIALYLSPFPPLPPTFFTESACTTGSTTLGSPLSLISRIAPSDSWRPSMLVYGVVMLLLMSSLYPLLVSSKASCFPVRLCQNSGSPLPSRSTGTRVGGKSAMERVDGWRT